MNLNDTLFCGLHTVIHTYIHEVEINIPIYTIFQCRTNFALIKSN